MTTARKKSKQKRGKKELLHGERRRTVYVWLFWLYTAVVLLLTVAECLSHEKYVLPHSMFTIYVAWLAIFAGEKEFSRWRMNVQSKHLGELWIPAWGIAFFVLGILVGFKPDEIAINQVGYGTAIEGGYHIPRNLPQIIMAVFGIYIPADLSKRIHEWKEKKKKKKSA